MNAHSSIKLDPLGTFMPWAPEDERDMRRRILKCQRLATARAMSCVSHRARALFWDATQIAGESAFAPAPAAKLLETRNALLRMFIAADAIEQLEAGDGS